MAAEASGCGFGFIVGLVAFGATDTVVGSSVAGGVLSDGCRVAAMAFGEVLRVIWGGVVGSTVPVRWGAFSGAVWWGALALVLRSALASGVAWRGITFSGALFATAVGLDSSSVGVTMVLWASLPMGAAGGGDSGWIGVAMIGIAGIVGVESVTGGADGGAVFALATTGGFRCSTNSGTKITASAVMTAAPMRRWAKRGSKTESPVVEVWGAMEQETHDGGKVEVDLMFWNLHVSLRT